MPLEVLVKEQWFRNGVQELILFILYMTRQQIYSFMLKIKLTTLGTGRFTNGIEDIDWHHVVGVYDGANVFVYVDTIKGDVIGDLTTNTGSSLLNVFIGESTNDHWPGLIDDVRVYNRALSAEEVERLYNMGR